MLAAALAFGMTAVACGNSNNPAPPAGGGNNHAPPPGGGGTLPNENLIIGTWDAITPGYNVWMRFNSDGTLMLSGDGFVDTGMYTVSGNLLTLVFPDGEVIRGTFFFSDNNNIFTLIFESSASYTAFRRR